MRTYRFHSGLPKISKGTPLPCVVTLYEAERDAQLAVFDDAGNRHTVVVPRTHRWLSLGVDGELRSHEAAPPVLSKLHDGTEQATLDFLRQPEDSQRWATELAMQPENHWSEEADPFSGIH